MRASIETTIRKQAKSKFNHGRKGTSAAEERSAKYQIEQIRQFEYAPHLGYRFRLQHPLTVFGESFTKGWVRSAASSRNFFFPNKNRLRNCFGFFSATSCSCHKTFSLDIESAHFFRRDHCGFITATCIAISPKSSEASFRATKSVSQRSFTKTPMRASNGYMKAIIPPSLRDPTSSALCLSASSIGRPLSIHRHSLHRAPSYHQQRPRPSSREAAFTISRDTVPIGLYLKKTRPPETLRICKCELFGRGRRRRFHLW